jgi:EAL domain-containing protein (putative c-di-GMP-specific phosphodiesterase class I)
MSIVIPDSFVLQPVYAQSGKLIFAEVLARFHGRNTQPVILEAERNGDIVSIDLAGLEYGLASALPVSVNISCRTASDALLDVSRRIRPGITVEITETHPANLDKLRALAFEVHARNGRVSLDDVGEGEFTDLSWVKKVIEATHPDWLKISINANETLVAWCMATQIPMVVERIETQKDMRTALKMGASGLQGWFFDAPEGLAWLRRQRSADTAQGWDELALAMA